MMNPDMIARLMTLADRLNALGWKMGTAESCTGGAIACAATELAGASSWFAGGVVAYDNAIKQDVLFVDANTLVTDGAVSAAAVAQMAQGGLKVLDANVIVSVSGIAGPGGGTPEKPVGTVFWGWGWRDMYGTTHVRTYKEVLSGSRSDVRQRTVELALDGLITLCERVKLNMEVPEHVFADAMP
ncbi:MAG: CinA family protein [Formosimonas sp.]